MVHIDRWISAPQFLTYLLPRDEFPRPFQQETKDAERLFLEPDSDAGFPEFPSFQIDLEGSEPDSVPSCVDVSHCGFFAA